jgi:phosphoglucosamine mutase
MPRKLFGTDGVRGRVGDLITPDLALGLARTATGQAAAERPQVLVVRDTRESGEMLEAAVSAGVTAAGGEVFRAGVLPTPAVPLLIGHYGFDLGVMLSASHNPYHDNGIKFFGADGFKLTDAQEEEIEAALQADQSASNGGAHDAAGHVRDLRGAEEDYIRALHTRFAELDLTGIDVLLDTAHGATYRVAPELFRRLGADVTVVADAPDGRNINLDCGSTHVDKLAPLVAAGGHDIGFAYDGDGDRVLAVDRNGVLVDGDELLALAALHLREVGRLPGDGVVVTVMTNFGFHQAMREAGIEVVTTPVGDRYVLDELRGRGWTLGGEQSGHLIEMSMVPTGDGTAGSLLTLEALRGRDLADRDAMHKLPQTLVNVRVSDRGAFDGSAEVADAIRLESEALEGRGRVLVRPSGTEPLVRVMVEAPTEEEAHEVADRLASLVTAKLA